MRRRPTRKALIVGGAGAVLFLGASTAQAGWLFVLAAAVLGLAVGSLFVRHPLAAIELERSVPRRVRVGDEVRVGLEVTNHGRSAQVLVRIEDRFAAFETLIALCERLEPGVPVVLELVRRSTTRGVYEGGEILIVAGAPFGLLRSKCRVDVGSRVVVVPSWVDLRTFPILEPASFPFETLHERARTGAGEEFLGVREYRPGDPPRAVHWRSTARIGRLVVREYQEETTSRVALVLAGSDDGTPPDSSFEALVRAAASIARYALVTGHPVDLFASDPSGRLERGGDVDPNGVLDWLAAVRPGGAPIAELVEAALTRISQRGTVILCSPTSPKAGADLKNAVRQVQAAGSRSIVVAARSTTWGQRGDAELEDEMLARIRELAPVRILEKGKELASCLAG